MNKVFFFSKINMAFFYNYFNNYCDNYIFYFNFYYNYSYVDFNLVSYVS